MTRRKHRQIPQAAELPRLFDKTFVDELEHLAKAKLPTGTDRVRLRAGILYAALRYVAASSGPRRDEIVALFGAAVRYRHRETARRVAEMSEPTRTFIEKRGNSRSVGLTIPNSEAFEDPARRDEACETIVGLLRVGMRGGRPILYAPPAPQPRPPRRVAELGFVLLLEYTYQDATGVLPSYTANPERRGPFARLVQACLDRLAGVGVVNADEMLNELHRRRKKMDEYLRRRQQLNELLRRWEQLKNSGPVPKP